MVIHLPPGMVGLLNALYWNSPDLEDELHSFQQLHEATGGWYQFNSAYALNAEERTELENFAVLWEEIGELLDNGPTLEALVPPLYQSVHIMNEVNKRREAPHYSILPAVNEILLAGAAFCSGEGEARGVEDRLSLLFEYMTNVRGLFYEQREKLPDQIAEELDKGFALVQSGIDQLQQWAEGADEGSAGKEAVAAALSEVKDGASLVEFLIEWDRKEKERLHQVYGRFNIPMVGMELEMGLESARIAERRQWRRAVLYTQEQVLPKFDEFWDMVGPTLLLPPEDRLELLDQVHDVMEEVRGAVAAMLDDELAGEEALDGLEHALEEATNVFREVEARALRGEHLRGKPQADFFEAIRGLLGGTVPDAALAELLAQGAPDVVAAPLAQYLESGNEEFLFEAAAALVESVEQQPEVQAEAPSDWACTYCGQKNPVGQSQCSHCQAAPPTSSLGWEA